jgi:hypothetical protein
LLISIIGGGVCEQRRSPPRAQRLVPSASLACGNRPFGSYSVLRGVSGNRGELTGPGTLSLITAQLFQTRLTGHSLHLHWFAYRRPNLDRQRVTTPATSVAGQCRVFS